MFTRSNDSVSEKKQLFSGNNKEDISLVIYRYFHYASYM